MLNMSGVMHIAVMTGIVRIDQEVKDFKRVIIIKNKENYIMKMVGKTMVTISKQLMIVSTQV